jgi:hypothetical protein
MASVILCLWLKVLVPSDCVDWLVGGQASVLPSESWDMHEDTEKQFELINMSSH